jgi:hypothetical protein
MRRLADFFARLTTDEVAKRAIQETLADGQHQVRGAASRSARLLYTAATLTAVGRVFLHGLSSFGKEHPMRDFSREVTYAIRRLGRSPFFTIFAIVTLALGIGTMTATYAFVRTVLGPPSGVRNADRILNVSHSAAGVSANVRGFSLQDFDDLRARQTVFQNVMAWHSFGSAFAAEGESAMATCPPVRGFRLPRFRC